MPRLAWLSDLHLDRAGPDARTRLYAELRQAAPDRCLVTGDMALGGQLLDTIDQLARAAGCPVDFVLGNHDHYGSSVAAVRDAVIAHGKASPGVQWLPPAGVVQLDNDTALLGVDGWADGGFGDALTTPFRMNDDRWIAELAAQPSRRGKLAVRQALAQGDAARLATLLGRAVAQAQVIIVATHVPPFVEALPRTGHLSSAEWLPLLVCRATGDVLRRVALEYPEHRFLVLAGHTHVVVDVDLAANLRCVVAGARYGEPEMTVLCV